MNCVSIEKDYHSQVISLLTQFVLLQYPPFRYLSSHGQTRTYRDKGDLFQITSRLTPPSLVLESLKDTVNIIVQLATQDWKFEVQLTVSSVFHNKVMKHVSDF